MNLLLSLENYVVNPTLFIRIHEHKIIFHIADRNKTFSVNDSTLKIMDYFSKESTERNDSDIFDKYTDDSLNSVLDVLVSKGILINKLEINPIIKKSI